MLSRIANWSFSHRSLALGLWVVGLVASLAGGQLFGGDFVSNPTSPDSESTEGFDLLEKSFGGQTSDFPGTIVFQANQGVDDPEVQRAMSSVFAALDAEPDISVLDPYSPEGARQITQRPARDIAFATVNFERGTDQLRGAEVRNSDAVKAALAEAEKIPGLEVEFGGEIFAEFAPPESELIGLAFAVVVLIAAFGSVLAMGLPIAVALAGVGTGAGLILMSAQFLDVPDFATVIGAMIGIGVGIDYALFIVTRYREGLRNGLNFEQANIAAYETAGRSVVFAGMTVVISLLGMLVMGLPFISALGISASMTVLVTMLASVTLLPALLSFAGPRIEVTRRRGLIAAGFVAAALLGVGLKVPALAAIAAALAVLTLVLGFFVEPLQRIVEHRPEKPANETLWYRWSRVVQHHPWISALAATTILLVLASPLLGLRLGFSDTSNYGEETTTRQAYELTVDGFGAGFNGPLLLAAEISGPDDLATLGRLVADLEGTEGVASVAGPQPNNPASPNAALIQVIAETGPQDEATEALVHRIRDEVIPGAMAGSTIDVKVTGQVPAQIDFTTYLSRRMLVFFAAVLGLSFLLLMAVFRSVLVPLKAVIMNLLSIGAAYGVVIATFQWGWGTSFLGIAGGAPIEPFMPMMLFAIVFGLSMDYEVFLISRIREDFDKTGDAMESVANGLASTARVITAAAAIMVVVFGSFMLEENRIIKLFGMGLASAIFLDATLVRMLLVPATMELLGDRNWWLPKWLDRILPTINVEGHAKAPAVVATEASLSS